MTRALFVLALVACSAPPRGPNLDVDRALEHAHALVQLGPRQGESDAAKQAVAYIERALAAIGATPVRGEVGVVDLPEIVVLGHRYREARRTTTTDPNILVRFGPASGKAVLVMAHYDSVPTSPGAVDNAAAVGVVIELARHLQAAPPATPVILALTAREEDGLIGAEALARRDDIAFAIALDLIGGDGDLVLNGASTLIGRAEMRWIADAADRAGVIVRGPLAHRVVSRWWPQAERSDHGPFTRHGVRAVHFYHRGQDGDLIDLAYHSQGDTFDRIHRAAVDEVGRLLVALVASPPPAHDGDGFWVPQLVNVIVPRWLLLAIEALLASVAIALLVRMRREGERGGPGLLVGVGCAAVALVAAYAVERSTELGVWVLAPGYHVIAETLVLAGVLGLATRVVARWRPWIGARRYLAIAIVLPLAFGLLLIAIDAGELAWIWLVPAACASVAPSLRRARIVALVPSLLPALLVLAPGQLREAAWNGFASPGMPLVGWLALVAIPPIAAAAYAFRDRGHSGPLGTFVLTVGWGLAICLGILMVVRYDPPCTAAKFRELRLACERAPRV